MQPLQGSKGHVRLPGAVNQAGGERGRRGKVMTQRMANCPTRVDNLESTVGVQQSRDQYAFLGQGMGRAQGEGVTTDYSKVVRGGYQQGGVSGHPGAVPVITRAPTLPPQNSIHSKAASAASSAVAAAAMEAELGREGAKGLETGPRGGAMTGLTAGGRCVINSVPSYVPRASRQQYSSNSSVMPAHQSQATMGIGHQVTQSGMGIVHQASTQSQLQSPQRQWGNQKPGASCIGNLPNCSVASAMNFDSSKGVNKAYGGCTGNNFSGGSFIERIRPQPYPCSRDSTTLGSFRDQSKSFQSQSMIVGNSSSMMAGNSSSVFLPNPTASRGFSSGNELSVDHGRLKIHSSPVRTPVGFGSSGEFGKRCDGMSKGESGEGKMSSFKCSPSLGSGSTLRPEAQYKTFDPQNQPGFPSWNKDFHNWNKRAGDYSSGLSQEGGGGGEGRNWGTGVATSSGGASLSILLARVLESAPHLPRRQVHLLWTDVLQRTLNGA